MSSEGRRRDRRKRNRRWRRVQASYSQKRERIRKVEELEEGGRVRRDIEGSGQEYIRQQRDRGSDAVTEGGQRAEALQH